MLAVACMGCDQLAQKYEDLNDDYSKIMVQVRHFLAWKIKNQRCCVLYTRAGAMVVEFVPCCDVGGG